MRDDAPREGWAVVTDRRSWLALEATLAREDLREWLLLTGDRLLVSLLEVTVLVAVFAAVMASGIVPLVEETPVLFLLFALIAANFTLISIVTSLSQLVIGRRLESPGDIRQTLDDTILYREDVGETIDRSVMPVKSDAFFLTLFEAARDDLERVESLTAEGRTRRSRKELEDLVAGFRSHTDDVIGHLEHPSSELKHALFAAMNADYETYAHRAWYLETEYADEFTGRVAEPLGRLSETLEHIIVAGRLFEVVFIESEVSELSRYLLYVGIPVQVAAALVMLSYTAPLAEPLVPDAALGVVVPAVLVAGFAPFLVLSSYIVRLTIVARRTADTFPFSSQLERRLALRNGPDGKR
jgi:hypothetical protein